MLLDSLKSYLKITWNDEDGDLEKIITRAKDYLQNDIAGVTLDFEGDTSNNQILLDCCRYIYNNAFEYFEDCFKSQLLRLQLKCAVNTNETDQ